MDKELFDRVKKLEEKIDLKKKDVWDKIQSLTGVIIPIVIALVGWYYTNQNSKNQLEIQKMKDENEYKVALINSNVGQSEMIKNFMPHLTSNDPIVKNIAIEAILYAAPGPGKKIVEVLSKSTDEKTRSFAFDALSSKRNNLVNDLFSEQKTIRLTAVSEIISNWTNDELLFNYLLDRVEECLSKTNTGINCNDGLYNVFYVIPSFTKTLIDSKNQKIKSFIDKIPQKYPKTIKIAKDILKN